MKLIRREGGKAACTVRQRDLPPGVTAADVAIAADKSEAEFEFKVSPKAVAGTYSLWLQTETKIKTKLNPQLVERLQQYRAYLQSLHDDPEQAVAAQHKRKQLVVLRATAADTRPDGLHQPK